MAHKSYTVRKNFTYENTPQRALYTQNQGSQLRNTHKTHIMTKISSLQIYTPIKSGNQLYANHKSQIAIKKPRPRKLSRD